MNWSVSIAIVLRNMWGRALPSGIAASPDQVRLVADEPDERVDHGAAVEFFVDSLGCQRGEDPHGVGETASATAMASATGSLIHQCLRGRPGRPLTRVEATAGAL